MRSLGAAGVKSKNFKVAWKKAHESVSNMKVLKWKRVKAYQKVKKTKERCQSEELVVRLHTLISAQSLAEPLVHILEFLLIVYVEQRDSQNRGHMLGMMRFRTWEDVFVHVVFCVRTMRTSSDMEYLEEPCPMIGCWIKDD